jgi:hypothetical protein
VMGKACRLAVDRILEMVKADLNVHKGVS